VHLYIHSKLQILIKSDERWMSSRLFSALRDAYWNSFLERRFKYQILRNFTWKCVKKSQIIDNHSLQGVGDDLRRFQTDFIINLLCREFSETHFDSYLFFYVKICYQKIRFRGAEIENDILCDFKLLVPNFDLKFYLAYQFCE
jgi:hypothetical protein